MSYINFIYSPKKKVKIMKTTKKNKNIKYVLILQKIITYLFKKMRSKHY